MTLANTISYDDITDHKLLGFYSFAISLDRGLFFSCVVPVR